jgi:hypothetical protein
MWNYINVITLFPAALLLNEWFLDRFCAGKEDSSDDTKSATKPKITANSTEQEFAAAVAWEAPTKTESKKKKRKRLTRGKTLSIAERKGNIKTESLSTIERFFYNHFTNVIWNGRYFWLLLGFTMATVGTWAGFTFFKPLKGQPQIFLKNRNQGGLDDYKYNRFASMSEDVIHTELVNAIKSDTEYTSAADAANAQMLAANSLRSVMKCDIQKDTDPHNNLGPKFTVDGDGVIEKLFSIVNIGNATG